MALAVRIVVEGTASPANSYGVVNLSLAAALAARGHEVVVRPWDVSSEEFAEACRASGVPVLALGGGPADVWIRQSWPPAFERPRGAERFFVIQPFEYGAVPAAWVAEAEAADGVLVPSRFVKETWVRGGASPDRVWVVPNGVWPVDPTPRASRDPDSLVVGFVGGAIWRKGIDLAIEALDALDDAALERVRLVVKEAGHDSYYWGQSLLDEVLTGHPRVGVRTEVVRTRLDASELDLLYGRLEVLLAPYRAEGFGLPILEAMGHGVVPIVPDAGPAPEFVDATCGVLVPSRCVVGSAQHDEVLGASLGPRFVTEVAPRHLADAVLELLEDAVRRRELSRSARERAQQWSWDRAAGVLEEVLARHEQGMAPPDAVSALLAAARLGGARGIGALVELGDLHGAAKLAAITEGAEAVRSRLAALASQAADLWSGACHRAAIPSVRLAHASWHAHEGDRAATARVARYLAPLLARSRRVLDVGCGEGAMLRELERRGVGVLGIELDPARVAALGAEGFEVLEGDARSVLASLPQGAVDGAFLGHIVEHFAPADLSTLLEELARVVAPEGVVVIQTPNPAVPGVMEHVFWLDPTHVRPYPAEVLRELLAEAGFDPVDIGWTSLAPIAPLDLVVVARRRVQVKPAPTAPARGRPIAIVIDDQASGFAVATRSFLADLERAALSVEAVPLTAHDPRRSALVHDLPLTVLAEGGFGAARFARTAWEVRGVPARAVRALSRYERIWTFSTWSARTLAESGVAPERVAVWKPRLDLELDHRAVLALRRASSPAGRVLGVLAWDGRKNPEALVRAFVRAWEVVQAGSLTLKLRGVSQEAASAWLAGIVPSGSEAARSIRLVVGDLPRAAVLGLYLEADVYCLPTRGEGFGLPFLEAMSAGCAVVAPDEGGHRDVVDERQWLVPGRYVPVDARVAPHFRGGEWYEVDLDALTETLIAVLGDPEEVQRRQQAALARAHEAAEEPVDDAELAVVAEAVERHREGLGARGR